MSKVAASQVRNQVAAVVVTYNRIEMLKQCLEHLKHQTFPCDVLVVNNASTDGTEKYLEKYAAEHINVHVHNQLTNTGGAGGFSHGMRWAVEAGYDYVWVMDDDCLPNPDALEKLMEADEILNGEYGWLSSVALWTDGTECKMNRQKLKKSFYEKSPLLKHGIVMAEQATFVSLFLRTEIIHKHGLPIKEFFIWGDDIEFTRRIAVRENIPSFVVGQSQVVHAMKENNGSSVATDNVERISRYNYAFRNENYFYRKEGMKGFLYFLAKSGLNILRILRYSDSHKLRRIAIIIRQLFAGLFFNPKTEYIEEKVK